MLWKFQFSSLNRSLIPRCENFSVARESGNKLGPAAMNGFDGKFLPYSPMIRVCQHREMGFSCKATTVVGEKPFGAHYVLLVHFPLNAFAV